jgi:hypothetical protein
MDQGQVKGAIRSYLPSSRLIYRTLAIVFLLTLILSCWPSALAKLPFIPSIHHELNGTWQSRDWYVVFGESHIRVRSISPCRYSRSYSNVIITEQKLTFKDPAIQQSYKIVPSISDGILDMKPLRLFIEGAGPIPSGDYRYLGDVFIGYQGDTFVSLCTP